MTRTARIHATHTVFHIIGRFVDRQFRMNCPEARDEYLRRLGQVVQRTDWTVLAYALMSSHVHLVVESGREPTSRLVLPLHAGFAGWLNRAQGRFGPVFAERHTTVLVSDGRTAYLIVYVHNNPVRAAVIDVPERSTWTSHRAYLGLEERPPWLDVSRGLELSGFGDTDAGRAHFADFARLRAGDPRNPELSGDLKQSRKVVREALGSAVEMATPSAEEDGQGLRLVAPDGAAVQPRWPGQVATAAGAAAAMMGVTAGELRGRHRGRLVAAARRLALLVWVAFLGRRLGEMAAHLGLTPSAASQLLWNDAERTAELRIEAELLAARLWGEGGPAEKPWSYAGKT